uniref:Dipeptidyl-peptidase 4 n=1 Tax=Amphilophus citrinellus TaxID=61819 RepID=A0A3Q0SR88_AMPCI
VSIAKVLLGVFGAAVVVILIAVPTAIFLNGESLLLNATHVGIFSVSPLNTSDRKYFTHASLRCVCETHTISLFKTQAEKKAYDYQLSADHRYVAFMSNYSKLWRHSFTASYSLYDRESEKFITPADIPDKVQYFAWAPEGNKLAFVWNNNVYIKTSPNSPPQQVTSSGEENYLLNGIPDWVYEEEMFSSNQGLWWSPGGKYVAYAEFNETGVHTIEYSWYGENQYPSTVSIPYPKPGTPNPTVKLFVVDTDNTTKITEVVVPAPFRSHYLATVTWVTDECLAVQWLKRVQNHLILQLYNFTGSSWDPYEHLEVTSSGWIGRFSPPEPVFAADKNSYYLLMSDIQQYKHIHHVVGGKATAITSGRWEVIDILKVTADSVYFSSNEEGECLFHCFTFKSLLNKMNKTCYVACLTCKLRKNCQYNSAYFSHNAAYYRMACSGPGIPYYSLMDNTNNKEKQVLEDNEEFASMISGIQMPTVREGAIKLDLPYQMFLPPGFDESKKYPLLIDVYAGPCSQKVNSIYRVSWSTYLASSEKIIVASFDGRGSGYQGDKLMYEIYNSLGTKEVEDQITAAREFVKMGFIDKNRVAIWGWSYGGYVTSMVLGSGSGVFKCGMAVAPVSKWHYYGIAFIAPYCNPFNDMTSYLQLSNTTVTARAKNFHSVKYLLIHGTADDNVHFQQAAEISEALVEAQVDFEAMWYTDKDHGLSGAANKHVYTHMTHFLLRCFA